MSATLVIAAGEVPVTVADRCRDFTCIVVADGGLDAARRHRLIPTHVVGDLDSAAPSDVEWAEAQGARISEYPRDKDATDLELALENAATAEGPDGDTPDRLVVIGVEGGRTDHVIGNWSVIAGASESCEIEVWTETAVTHLVRRSWRSGVVPGTTVSLLPWGGAVTGVTTAGFRWELTDAQLSPVGSHGISNVAIGDEISVEVRSGSLYVAVVASA